jgi:hypothetical protein
MIVIPCILRKSDVTDRRDSAEKQAICAGKCAKNARIGLQDPDLGIPQAGLGA